MHTFTIFIVTITISQIQCARILGIIPVASYSHQIPFQPLWRELSLRGHQVTVMTTDPIKDPSLKNLTEIDLSKTYEIYKKHNFTEVISDENKSFSEILTRIRAMFNEAGEYQFAHPEVQNLIHNKGIEFDVVILEAQLPGMMAFSWRFNCPMIGITSLDSGMQYHLAMGNPVHPMMNPDINLPVENPDDMSFKDRIASFVYYIGYTHTLYNKVYGELHEKLKTIFGSEVPSPKVLHDNMAMLFINTHPIFHSLRPLNPNTIPIGDGIHIKEPKPLPKDIQNYLDNAKEGVIYFSMGTNVNEKMLRHMMPEILNAFNELPYKVLLKTYIDLENVPKNVEVYKWLPQQDILRHRNVKLFVTQGGLQSLQESVYNAVPVLGIPFFGDQISNVNKMVNTGYGLKLNKHNVTSESLKSTVLEVINNAKYREKVEELSDIFRDVEIPGIQRAVWWTEYVIRHKGARHLRNSAVDMPFWKYFMLDVIGFFLVVILLFAVIFYRIISLILKLTVKKTKLKAQ